MTGEAVNY